MKIRFLKSHPLGRMSELPSHISIKAILRSFIFPKAVDIILLILNGMKCSPESVFFVRKEQIHYWELDSEPEGYVVILKKN
jgi:hypothetical protein